MRISDWSSDVCSSDLGQVVLERADQCRRLHRGQQMAEEALLGGFECRASGRLGLTVQRAAVAGDVGGLHGGVEVVMDDGEGRSEEHTSELQSLMRISYAVFCLTKKQKSLT